MQVINEESIFLQALEIDSESARNEFLDRACDSDTKSRLRLGKMVEMHFSKGRILDATIAPHFASDAVAPVPEVGSMIGPYKLLQVIGEGGMGVVFMAEQQEPMTRMVALKVIKIGMDTRRVVARFESERQAMAMMDHPCITKVLDAGATESGRPFFVMELVRGQSITEYCDEKRLPLYQRLNIFVQVCNALEHAHQKGIIHRDIKPSNIMVTSHDGVPVPKIIDFGIAKAIDDRLTDKTLFTNYGEMIGTPLYMSPEQAEMSEPDVDTRTDIYSLGVLLYELLTGTTPFHDLKKKSIQAIRDAIRSNEPQLASTRVNNLGDTVKQVSQDRDTDVRSLHRLIRGELDWILMKCLARERKQRYQSAGALAREIERYLNGETVEAAAPTWTYRSSKFIRKHKAGVAIAAAFAILLFGSSLFSSVMALRANKAEKLASSRLEEVTRERDRALAAEKQIAELERQQRNLVAIHEAASAHNSKMMRRYFANSESPGRPAPEASTSESKASTSESRIRAVGRTIQVKPMGSVWRSARHQTRKPVQTLNQTPRNSFYVSEETTRAPDSHTEQGLEADEIQVFVVAGENEGEEDLVRMILKNQRKAFGENDVLVAQTLDRLGEMMCVKQKWHESESCFREAVHILKDNSKDNQQLSELRLKLADSLKKQGNIDKARLELIELKKSLNQLRMPKEVSGIMDSIDKEILELRFDLKPGDKKD